MIVALGAVAVDAQTNAPTPLVGVLLGSSEEASDRLLQAFRERLGSLGFVDGKSVAIQVLAADGDAARVPALALELVARKPDVIVGQTSTVAKALLGATQDIPIVMAIVADPVANGFSASVSRPSRNLTGFTTFNDDLSAKRLELLLRIAPATRRIGILWNPLNPYTESVLKSMRAAAPAGIEIASFPAQSKAGILSALERSSSEHVEALVISADPLTLDNRSAIIEHVIRARMPAMHSYLEEVADGALIGYGIDRRDNFLRAATYTAKILRGAKIADLPFEEPNRIELSVNLRTARAIGLAIPPEVVALADAVVE